MEKEEVIKAQHFLPQCYLQGFTDKGGKLQTLNLEIALKYGKAPYPREFTSAQICYEDDFYTIDKGLNTFNIRDIRDKYQVEKAFHGYENLYQLLIAKISQGQILTVSEASFLIRIIIDFKFRNKYFRDKLIGARQDEVINEASDEILNMLHNDTDYRQKYAEATMDEMRVINNAVREKLLNDPGFKKNAHLSALIRKADGYENLMNTLIPKLLHCRWVILESDGQFISNDNPGCSMDKINQIHNSYFDRDFMFFMPLTSSLCLTISDAAIDMEFYNNSNYKRYPKVKAPQNMIDTSNSLSFRHFNKFVYGADKGLLGQLAKSIQINK